MKLRLVLCFASEPGGPGSIGSQRVGHDWSDWACTADESLFSVVFLLDSGYSSSKGVTLFKWNGWNGWRMAVEWLKVEWLKNGWLEERRLGWCFSWLTPTCLSECILGKMNSKVRKSQHFQNLWAETEKAEQVLDISEPVDGGDRVNIHTYMPQAVGKKLTFLPLVINDYFYYRTRQWYPMEKPEFKINRKMERKHNFKS